MPLPDAKDPKTSNLYAQLRTSQLDSISQTAFDKVKDPLYVNAEWEDEARRLKLWGELSGKTSSSGPIPGTFEILQKSGTSVITILQPEDGQVYQLMSLAVSTLAGSGINFRLNDGTTNMLLATASASGVVTSVPDAPIYITPPAKLDCAVVSSSGTNIVQGAFIRVR